MKPRQSTPTRTADARLVAVFAFAGPIVGYLLVAAAGGFVAGGPVGLIAGIGSSVLVAVLGLGLPIAYAYWLGFLPAVLAGFVASLVAARIGRGLPYIAVATCAGAIATLAWWGVQFSPNRAAQPLLLGGAAGVVCALVTLDWTGVRAAKWLPRARAGDVLLVAVIVRCAYLVALLFHALAPQPA